MRIKNPAVSRCFRAVCAVAATLLTITTVRASNYESAVLNDQPVAFYALDLTIDNAGIATDLTGNSNEADYYNIYPTSGPTAYIPNAATFSPDVDSYVDLSTGTNEQVLQFTGPTTLEAWVQPADSTSFGDIIAKGYDASSYDEVVLRVNGPYGADFYGSFGTAGVSGGQQNTNWDYVVLSNDGTNTSLYINTSLIQRTSDTTGTINFSDPWAIGDGTSAGYTRYFNGNICMAAIYKHGLTPSQILTHYYYGEVNSSPTTSAPIITVQPQPQATYVGGTATFSVSVVSALATTNQWLKNGSPISGQTNASLTLHNVQPGDAVSYSVIVGNGEGTTNSAPAVLSLFTPNQLEWSGTDNSGVWDTSTSANWINLANSQQTVFTSGDQVLFNDTPGAPSTVTVSGTITPSLITVDSTSNNYIFAGSGSISGPATLVKEGPSTLTFYSPATFTGPVFISGGTIYAGDNSFTSVSSVTITNNATLDFGGGTYNSGQDILVSGTGVGGEGALYNSYNADPGEVFNITLAGNSTFGGSERWDFDGGSLSGPFKVTVNWSASDVYGQWNSVSIATNVGDIELAAGKLGILNMGSTFGNPAANLIVDSGTELDFYTGDPGYAKNIHVMSSGLMQIPTGFTDFNANVTLENGTQFNSFYGSGNQMLNGAFTLNGDVHFVLGDANYVFTNVISGAGGFVWDAYNHEMIFEAANTYSGPTVIGGGLTLALTGSGSISDSALIFFGGGNATNVSLDVSGRSDQTLTLSSGQTLGGIGAINGSLVVSPGATLAPGGTNAILGMTEGSSETGTLSVADNITLGGLITIKLDVTGSNDVVQAAGSLTYGGTLNLVNAGASALTTGSSFTVFRAGSLSGSFASVTPPTPGPGLAWDFSQLSSGKIAVIGSQAPTIATASVSNGNIILTGSGGPANGTFYVLTSTNLATPLSMWTDLSTNTFDGSGNFALTNSINPSASQRFYAIEVQ